MTRADSDLRAAYAGRAVLVTGGLGFVGSALVRRLAAAGARVRVLDSLLPLGGGSARHLDGVDRAVDVVIDDTRSRDAVDRAARGCDVVFHLAGHAGFSALATDWYTEVDIACLGTLNLLDAVRVHAPRARVVFASGLAVYGAAAHVPVDEEAPTRPLTLFGVHKLAGENYCGVYHARYEVATVVARLATLFGPRQRLRGAANGTVAQALDAALHGEAISVGGDGGEGSLVDVLHVDDATLALAVLGAHPAAVGGVFNVGRGAGVPIAEVAARVVEAAGRGAVRRSRETPVALGGVVGAVDRLRALGVPAPERPLADELRETLASYRSPSRAP